MEKHRASALGAACCFVALAAALWMHRVQLDRPAGFGVLLNSDVFMYFFPSAAFVHRELRQGHLPLWNPYQYAGQPFLGSHIPAGVYPPHLILMGLLEPAHALAASAIVHLSIAGTFTWLFAARLGLGTHARLVAALTYMLSGPLLLGIYMVPYLSAHAWFPAILWAVHGLLVEARPRWAVALAVVMALAFLAGHAQGFVYEVQFAFLFGLLGLCCMTPAGLRMRAVGLAAFAGVLTLSLISPQLLSAIELAQQGTRGLGGIPLEVASRGSVPPDSLLWGLLGYFETHRWSRVQGPARWLVTLPAATLPLVACGLLARRQRVPWMFFVSGAVLVGLFMLGDRGPVFPAYHRLPLGNLFRNPTRLAFLYTFLAAMLLAIGIQGVTEGLRPLAGRPAVATAATGLVAIVIVAELYARTKLGYAHPVLGVPFQGAPAELVDYMRAKPGNPRLFIEQVGRFPGSVMFFKTGMMHGISVVPDYEPNMPAAYRSYFRIPPDIWHGRLSILSKSPPLAPEVMGRLLDLMSVRYYALLRPSPGAEAVLRSVAPGRRDSVGPVGVFERPSALPRAYVVRRAVTEPDMDAAWRRMTDERFDPRREVVIGPPDDRSEMPLLDAGPVEESGVGPSDTATITQLATEKVVIETECSAPCLLVLTDLYYPGWRVYVDGKRSAVIRVNTLFRGAYLEPGAHRVEYRYEPAAVRIGMWVLFAAFPVTAALFWAERRLKNRGRR